MNGKGEPGTSLGKRTTDLREKNDLTQSKAVESSFATENAFRGYELGDRTPKHEALDRIACPEGVAGIPLRAEVQKSA